MIRAVLLSRAERTLGPRQVAALAAIRAAGTVKAGGPMSLAMARSLAARGLVALTIEGWGCWSTSAVNYLPSGPRTRRRTRRSQ